VEGESKAQAGPMKMTFKGVNGYDPMAKKFTRDDFDSMGAHTEMTSAGWEGDKLVFSGEGMMMGQKTKFRHTMTKKTDAEFASTMEMAGPDGKWKPMFDDVCKKSGGKK
jgi:hypothetical protein